MLAPALILAAALQQAPQSPSAPIPAPDSLFPAGGTVMRLYTDCDEARWPFGTEERYEVKTTEELDSIVIRLRSLEARWREYFAARAGDSIAPTPKSAWRYALAVRGRLLNNYSNPRVDGAHEAIDIFVQREGVEVRAPASGVVIAAGDGWRGSWDRRRRDLDYQGGGLSRRAGNAAIIFDPHSGGYFLFSHLQEGVLVRAGDVVRAGTPIGRVGHTGNASRPTAGRHLHLAYKEPGRSCGVQGVLVPVNPYGWLRDARARDLPLR